MTYRFKEIPNRIAPDFLLPSVEIEVDSKIYVEIQRTKNSQCILEKGNQILDLHDQILRLIKNVQWEFNTDARIYRPIEQNIESINQPPHKDFQMIYDKSDTAKRSGGKAFSLSKSASRSIIYS